MTAQFSSPRTSDPNPNPRSPPPAPALHRACADGAPPEAVRSLLCDRYPNEVGWKDADRMTPFHHACASGASTEVLRMLLEAAGGGDRRPLEEKDRHGRTPLHCACESGRASPGLVRLLVDSGPGALGTTDKRSRTPLHYACSRGASMEGAVRTLVERHPDALLMRDSGAFSGMTPLHLLCRFGGPTALVRLLAEARPEVTTWKDGGGRTPLLHAVERWAPLETVRLLAGAMGPEALGAKDGCGRTPLHAACGGGGPKETALFLLKECAVALEEEDNTGRTPLDVASPDLQSLLRQFRGMGRGKLDSQEVTAFFLECCQKEWWGGAWLVLNKYPCTVHTLSLEGALMAEVLARIGRSHKLQTMWEALRGAPGVMRVGGIY